MEMSMRTRMTTTLVPPREGATREETVSAFLAGEVGDKTIVTYLDAAEAEVWYPFELLTYSPIVTRWYSEVDDYQDPWVSYVVLPQETA